MKKKISFTVEGKKLSFVEDEDLVNQLFWALGATLAEIQVFESHMIFLLGGIKSKKKDVDLKILYEKDESKTLGILINELHSHVKDDNFKKLLKLVVDNRNYIIHKVLRFYGWPVISESQYQNAIDEILVIRDILHESITVIDKYIKSNKILELMTFDTIVEKIEN